MSRPSPSKKRISTVSGSPGASRTVMPPCDWPLRTWKRVSGTVASSTSSTLAPARLSPPMIARLSARADVDVVVADGPIDERVGLHDHIGAEHGVRPDVRAGLDGAVVADHDRALDPGIGADRDVTADPLAFAHPEATDVHADTTVED